MSLDVDLSPKPSPSLRGQYSGGGGGEGTIFTTTKRAFVLLVGSIPLDGSLRD